jgi:hypothetical protein
MTDIFKSADWAREADTVKVETPSIGVVVPEEATADMIWAMGQAADVLVSAECRARMWRAAVTEWRRRMDGALEVTFVGPAGAGE